MARKGVWVRIPPRARPPRRARCVLIRDHVVITSDQTVSKRRGQVGTAAAVGALAGAALGASRGKRMVAAGAMAGAVTLGTSEAVARARQRPGEIPARWHRIAFSVALAAPAGWAAGRWARLPRPSGRRRVRGAFGRHRPAAAKGRARTARGRVGRLPCGPAAPTSVDGGGRQCHRVGVPDLVGAAVPRRAAEPARRAGRRR